MRNIPHITAGLRLLFPRDYPQTVEGNLQYAVDRMLVAETDRDDLRGEMLSLRRELEQTGSISPESFRAVLVRVCLEARSE